MCVCEREREREKRFSKNVDILKSKKHILTIRSYPLRDTEREIDIEKRRKKRKYSYNLNTKRVREIERQTF